MPPTITIYGKPDCCLCLEALEVLERVRERLPFDLERVSIDADPALAALYGHRIPVVHLEGRQVFEYRVDEQRLVDLLRSGRSLAGVHPQGFV